MARERNDPLRKHCGAASLSKRLSPVSVFLPKMTEKRRRSQNFTLDEKEVLVELIGNYRNVILNKKTDGVTNKAKAKVWMCITRKFNRRSTALVRTKGSLMRVWEKLKTEAKSYDSTNEVKTQADEILGQVYNLMAGTPANVDVGDVDGGWPLDVHIEEMDPSGASASENEAEASCADNTRDIKECSPEHSSRMQSKSSYFKKRNDDAPPSPCSSFEDAEWKTYRKQRVEELKCQLLTKELHFKRRLHKLQLDAATKELEIKTEILARIKDGRLAPQHITGFQ